MTCDITIALNTSSEDTLVQNLVREAKAEERRAIEAAHREIIVRELCESHGWDKRDTNGLLEELGLEPIPTAVRVTAMIEVTYEVEPSINVSDVTDPWAYVDTDFEVAVSHGEHYIAHHEATVMFSKVKSVYAVEN